MRRWRELAFLTLLTALAGVSGFGQSVITITPGTVTHTGTQRVGLNMGTPTGYDSGWIYKNFLLPNNVGAEPVQLIQVQQVQTGATPLSTTQFVSNINNMNFDGVPASWWTANNPSSGDPAGTIFVAQSCGSNSQTCSGGGAELHCSSTITANTTAGSSPNGPTFTFSPACPAAIAVGDVIFLTKTYSTLSGTGTTGTVTQETSSTCGAACGTTAFDIVGAGSVFWNVDNLGGTPPDRFRLFCNFYNVANPCSAASTFKPTFWAKVVSGSPTVTITASRSGGFTCNTGAITLSGGATWTQYTGTASCQDSIGTSNGGAQISFAVSSGGEIYLDNLDFELDPSTTDPTNTSIYSDAYVNTLRLALNQGAPGNNGTLRYNINSTSLNFDDWIKTTYAVPQIVQGIHQYGGVNRTDTLQDFLLLCHVTGADPKLILPINLLETDAPHLIDFLYGSSGTTYGAKRIALGGPSAAGGYATWFRTIHMALGNENWNSGFLGYEIGFRSGTTDGLQDYMSRGNTIFTDMRGTASYIASQTDLILGGQQFNAGGSPSANFANFGHPDSIEISGYTQIGNINSVSTNAALFQPMMVEPWIWATLAGQGNQADWSTNTAATTTCGPGHNVACNLNIYEQGPSPFNTTMTQAQMNGFDGGAAQGVSQANQYLLQGENIATKWEQTDYSLAQYYNVFASLNQGIWGTAVDMSGASSLTNKANIPFGAWASPRPRLIGMYLDNQAIIGNEISCAWSGATGNAKIGSFTSSNAIPSDTNIPQLYVSCFQSATNPNNYSMVIRNTDLTNSYPITWGTGAGTIQPASSTVMQMAAPSANPLATNEAAITSWTGQTAAAVTMTSTTSNLTSGITVPPLSVTTLLFSTSSPPATAVQFPGTIKILGGVTIP